MCYWLKTMVQLFCYIPASSWGTAVSVEWWWLVNSSVAGSVRRWTSYSIAPLSQSLSHVLKWSLAVLQHPTPSLKVGLMYTVSREKLAGLNFHVFCGLQEYRMTGNFDERKIWQIWRIFGNINIQFVKPLLNKYNFTGVQAFINISSMLENCEFVKFSFRQNYPRTVSRKFSCVKLCIMTLFKCFKHKAPWNWKTSLR